jgi:hypothetical protein
MKTSKEVNEKWLQEQIANDPSILNLGEVFLKDLERTQPSGGRLDMLFEDIEGSTRYTVELQLGATDETHIVRTIEYWDIERKRYPNYEHVAVLVAEDITSRFFNVINLFNSQIPIIDIQISALQVGDLQTLHATTVLDLVQRPEDEEDNKVKKNNTQVLIKAVVANAVFIVITIGIVYYLNKTANLNLMEVLLKNFIILIFIALTEFAFLTFYGAHLISIDPNKVKFYMVESVKNILLSLKNENK